MIIDRKVAADMGFAGGGGGLALSEWQARSRRRRGACQDGSTRAAPRIAGRPDPVAPARAASRSAANPQGASLS